MTEQEAFDTWRATTAHLSFMTGWLIWCASLVQRGIDPAAVIDSRQAFDAWLWSVRADDWTEFDAWCAAARWPE